MKLEALVDHMGEEARAEQTLVDDATRTWCGDHTFLAAAAGVLGALLFMHDGELDTLELAGGLEADRMQGAAADAHGRGEFVDGLDPQQVVREGFAAALLLCPLGEVRSLDLDVADGTGFLSDALSVGN